MNWNNLTDFAIKVNSKNAFGTNKEISDWIPEDVSDLYKSHDPIKVELPFEGSSLVMVPHEKLETVLTEYGLDKESIVFATCDSDPFFINKKQVYTFDHGSSHHKWECLAESIDSFFEELINEYENDD